MKTRPLPKAANESRPDATCRCSFPRVVKRTGAGWLPYACCDSLIRAKAPMAKSRSWRVWAAEIWTRMRALPIGTTG